MAHNDKPWGLGAVDGSQILEEPLVLLVVLVLSNVAVDCTEWATVGDESLAFGGVGLVALDIAGERPLWAVWEVGLTIDGNEMSQTVIEGVPEVANTTSLGSGHAESVLVGGEITS